MLDYQWSVAEEFWREIDREAADLDVKVALELHPQNLVFNPAGIRELVERTGATNVGVELDASHLFWQWMDPVAVVQDLGPLVFHAAAKDVRINPAAAVYGVLDNRFRRLAPDEPRTNLGGDEWANEWPKDAAWDFVALGRGHDVVYWSTWLAALHAVDPDMLVNIEHEDVTRPHRRPRGGRRSAARRGSAGRNPCLSSSPRRVAPAGISARPADQLSPHGPPSAEASISTSVPSWRRQRLEERRHLDAGLGDVVEDQRPAEPVGGAVRS